MIERGIGTALADHISAQGGVAEIVPAQESLVESDADHRLREWSKQLSKRQWDGVLYLRALDMTPAADLEQLRQGQLKVLGDALRMTQLLATWQMEAKPRLWLLTQGAMADGAVNYEQSPLWGLGKTIMLEHPELRPVCLDLDPGQIEISNLLDLFNSPTDETQLAIRGDAILAARVTPFVATDSRIADSARQLETRSAGLLDSLVFQPIERRAPSWNEVEIRVRATGLNFKDVLNAMGMYPGSAGLLGGECAGEIVAVGEGVTDLHVGDSVIALVAGSFSTYLTASADVVVRKPAHLSFAQAATLAIPFITAYYALVHLGGIQAGDRVLIHAAAGGVGLAAIQIAQQAGAEIFATAGSIEKQMYLRSLGVLHVLHSRSLNFVDEIRILTEGQGVDLILNSLSDEFCAASLSITAANGRFVEIGKRGILAPEVVAVERPDVVYHIVDWSVDLRKNPMLIRGILHKIVQEITAGNLRAVASCSIPGRSNRGRLPLHVRCAANWQNWRYLSSYRNPL